MRSLLISAICGLVATNALAQATTRPGLERREAGRYPRSNLQLGFLAASQGKFEEAEKHFTHALQMPQSARVVSLAFVGRADCYYHFGEFEKAQHDYLEAMRNEPSSAIVLNDLAWFRATCPDGSFRNGPEAVTLALKAGRGTSWKDINLLDTIAAAYAEVGDFSNAVAYQERVMAGGRLGKEEAEKFRNRLALYNAHKPFRQYRSN